MRLSDRSLIASSSHLNNATRQHGSEMGDRYCARCRSLDFEKLLSMKDETTSLQKCLSSTIYTLGVVSKTMSNSKCPLCRIFAKHFPGTRNSTQQECVLGKISAIRYYFPYSGNTKTIQDTVLLSVMPSHVTRWTRALGRKRGMIYISSKPPGVNNQAMYCCPMNSSQANYQLAKEWIQHCKASHKGYCNPQLRYGVQSLPSLD